LGLEELLGREKRIIYMNELQSIIIGVFTIYLIAISVKLGSVLKETKKGNKDQQEIKTRLSWIKKSINDIQDVLRRR